MMRPLFVDKVKKLHSASLARCIVLTGDINGLFPVEEDGKVISLSLEKLLQKELSNLKYPSGVEEKFIILAVKGDGVHILSEEDKKELPEINNNENMNIVSSLRFIGKLLRSVAEKRKSLEQAKSEQYVRPICVVIDQADMIFPNLDPGRMTSEDKDVWKNFYDLLRDEDVWPDAETADKRPDLIILLSPTISGVNSKLFTLPKTEPVNILLPEPETLKVFAESHLEKFPIPSASLYGGKVDAVRLMANDARGLTLRSLENLLTAAHRDPLGSSLNRETIIKEINKHLETTLGGIVKFLKPEHLLTRDIVGFETHKAWLQYISSWVDNDPKNAPAGMTVVGPNGAGKTYMIEGWAAENGRTVLTIGGGMRSKWYGESGQFAELLESTVSTYNRVCIIIDEAHTAFGSIHDSNTHEAEAQLTSHIIRMISNKKYLGKIFWVLITTRPDLLDPDFTRSERCSLFLPICYPEGDDRKRLFDWTIERFTQKGVILSDEEKKLFEDKQKREHYEFAAGDYRRLGSEFFHTRKFYQEHLGKELTFTEFISTWKPTAVKIGQNWELQLLLAAKNTDLKDLLPERYRGMDDDEIENRIEAIKAQSAFE